MLPDFLRWIPKWSRRRTTISPEQFVTALYRGLLHRHPDEADLRISVDHVAQGMPLNEAVEFFVASGEYRERMVAMTLEAANAPGIRPHPYNPTTLKRLRDAQIALQTAGPNILFLQTADPYHYHDMLVETSRTVRAFCQKHGFRYEYYVGIKRGVYSWHAAYNRIILLKELVESGFAGWIFYLDADAIITDQDFDLRAYLQDKSEYAAIFADPAGRDAWYRLNNGIFLINTINPEAQILIDKWFKEFMKISDHELSLATDWDDLPHDQDLLHAVFFQNPDFRTSIFLESPVLLGWGPGFVEQYTRGAAEGLADRKRLIKSKVDQLLGPAETASKLHEMNERDVRVVISALYKSLLGEKAKWEASDLYAAVLREDGLQYGLQRVIETLIQSEEFKARFTPGTETEPNHEQARLIGTALYRSVFEREPDWHALNGIPATLRQQGLEIGLQTVIADMIRCDEFRIRQELRRQAITVPDP